ncbi:MAG: DUF2304 domain-containing protein [Kiritimatiellae bacterium]|nr:DUF2304 domain-containing protein [Kiritimatiellia bacterium]MDD5522836.1 DUF2304 domain-containing protein [Kiritimatiellia bacterium]
MLPRQLIASIVMSILLLILIIRLIQKQRLDIAYCWLWLAIGLATLVVVIKYEWLTKLSETIGALTNTTTLFLLGFFVVLLMCLQFSLAISAHRRQLKKLCQQVAILEGTNKNDPLKNESGGKDKHG